MDSTIYYKLTDSHAYPPSHQHQGDAGWDLYTTSEVNVLPNSFIDVHTHIEIALPDNLWGRITGRSSTWRGWGLIVVEGIIDTGYRGELFIGVYNPKRSKNVTIPRGARIAQLLLHEHVDQIMWMPSLSLPDTSRGPKGFGSTGK